MKTLLILRFSAHLLALSILALGLTPAFAQLDSKPPRTGKFRGDITDPVKNDVIMKVAMRAPEKLPARKHLGLLLLFHGYQGNENNYIGLTLETLDRLKLGDQYVVISGKSKGPGWTANDDEPVLRLIAWAKETYPIDPRRVFIFGSSNGAAFVGRFGWEHQEIIAGVVGYCGSYKFAKAVNTDNAAETKTEWYFVHGGKDNPQNSRKACDELKAKGYRYVFRQMDGYGHTDIWDSKGHPDSWPAELVRGNWLLWMHALRHKEIPPSDEEQKTLATFGEKLKQGTLAETDALFDEVARIGGPAGGKAFLPAFASPKRGVRQSAAVTADKALFGKEVVTGLIALLDDENTAVRQCAITALVSGAMWRYPEAQAALCRFARNVKRDADERVFALESLSMTVQLSMLGNFEDPLPVWTFVLHLNDELEVVREYVFRVLTQGREETFGYKINQTAEERKAAIEKWKAWSTEKCGPQPKEPSN